MRRFAAPVILFVAAALFTGTAAASSPNLKSMTLRLSDLPPGFTLASSHSVSKAQLVKDQGYAMPGYIIGRASKFKRAEGSRTAEVDSNVSLYRSSAQAHSSMLDTYRKAGKYRRISVGAPLGDEARAYKVTASGVAVYVTVWRYGNVKASVFFAAIASIGATAEGATRLAVKQQRRIKAAL